MEKIKITVTSSPELKVDLRLVDAETMRRSGRPYIIKLEDGRTVIRFPARVG